MSLPSLQSVDLPNGRMAYRAGGDGPPLLMLHGWGGSSRHWVGAFSLLAGHHTVYAIDMPGYGESPPGYGGGGLRGLEGAALAFIDAMGLGQVGLCGHSLGGAVALLAAAARPSQVARLALVGFGIARSPEEAARSRQIGAQMGAAAALWGPLLALSRPWLALSRPWRQLAWATPPLPTLLAAPLLRRTPDAAALALGVADLVAMDALAALEGAASAGDPQLAQALGRAAMPALVLAGKQDPVFPPSSAAALAAALPSARLSLLDDCGHVPMVEQPATCYAALGTFFAE
jgi:pimeloyl-ACP methyl ester carboxylesterase